MSEFDDFWEVYPRKENGKKAKVSWDRDNLNEKASMIIVDVKRRAKSEKWQNRKYIPLPTTYLNGERWNDEHEEPIQYASKATNYACTEFGCEHTAVHRKEPFLCPWHYSKKYGGMEELREYHIHHHHNQYEDETREEWLVRLKELRDEGFGRFLNR